MTTTVYDSVSKVIASDDRWSANLSIGGQKVFVFADENRFAKVADIPQASMVVAGNGLLIAEWKKWWYTSLDEEQMPPTVIEGINAVAILIIDKVNNKILFDAGMFAVGFCTESQKILSVFSGSGRNYASSCWDSHRCPYQCIVTASTFDYQTSGNLIYVDFNAGSTNISEHSYDFNYVMEAIMERGFVMEQNKAIPIAEHALSKEIREQFNTGQAVASAPVTGLSKFVWTDKRREKLKSAIREVKRLREEA